MQAGTIKTTRGNDRNPQSLHAVQLSDALLRIQTVAQATGLSDATIYRKLAAGEFPEPIRLGKRCTRWKAADVRTWIQSQGVSS
ncbi:helix-turn-helix transcriptional regulator [Roseateles toxinivorans]|uniref:AlpA family transcriptional regulator n=1 Tax=Roseateles toxinivorans TaxID=270368 RepID=A0A4R6QLC6_9BURK|nr:AlpA family phage regulatory protein [Roseateles toxinivorans]TDP63005.1 AlpA family transcriptional regulator [Roseateles toxinivorans]